MAACGNEYIVDKAHWDTVMQRMRELPKVNRETTGQYNQPRWPDAPNTIVSPFIPAVVRYYHNNQS